MAKLRVLQLERDRYDADMTRIVAGSARGRTLAVPRSGTRPTSERVREALFSHLEHYGYLEGATVADLFAGSGALALEALSRGAARAVAVEAHAGAAKIIAANARTLGFAEQMCVRSQKVESYLSATSEVLPLFDVAFLDPPYEYSDAVLAHVLELLAGHVAADGVIVVERAARSPQPVWPENFALSDERKMGDTRVWSAERTPETIA